MECEIEVPNSTWYLDVVPMEGWVPDWVMAVEAAIALAIALLSMHAVYSFMTVLQQKVELVRQNNTDGLTGIGNGRFYIRKIREFAEEGIPFVIFYLDMNNFKQINDKYGHDAGDKVLQETAARIRGCIRDTDIAARMGGDEFTIAIIDEKSREFCRGMKERLHDAVEQPFQIGDIDFCPKISIGYARFPEEGREVEKVMKLADQRMYEEKRQTE